MCHPSILLASSDSGEGALHAKRREQNDKVTEVTRTCPLGMYTEQFQEHLERQRYSADSISQYIGCISALGIQMKALNIGPEDLDPEMAVGLIAKSGRPSLAFLLQLTTRRPPLRDKTLSSHLRNFFRYLFKAGETTTNLALGIPSVAQRYGTRLPRHLSAEQVDTLVKAVRTETSTGRRNYAMVLLIARLGLRAPEIIVMQIDDLDWRSGEIIVRGKGKRHDRVPLPSDVGEALTDYIRLDRKTAARALFVSNRAPHRPFRDGQVLNDVLKRAFARTGLTPSAPPH